jgi:hypothetical protein
MRTLDQDATSSLWRVDAALPDPAHGQRLSSANDTRNGCEPVPTIPRQVRLAGRSNIWCFKCRSSRPRHKLISACDANQRNHLVTTFAKQQALQADGGSPSTVSAAVELNSSSSANAE